MDDNANFIQKNERSFKRKDYEKTLSVIEYLENNSTITMQKEKQLTEKSLATAWRYIQILINSDALENDGNINNVEYVVKE